MKVSTFRSVGAKLFYYMTALVLITVAGNSFQYLKTFKDLQTQQVQDSLQKEAESAGSRFKGTIEMWKAQIATALPTLKSSDAKSTSEALQRFVDANPEFIALQILDSPGPKDPKTTSLGKATTSNTTSKEFEDKEPKTVFKKIEERELAWLKKAAKKTPKETKVIVESVAREVGLPVIVMAVRFDVPGTSHVVWALLAAWQSKLIEPLPESQFITSYVIDKKGTVFSAPKPKPMLERLQLSNSIPLVKTALTGNLPSGIEPEYKVKGERKLGAFYRMPSYGLTVLVEQDAEQAYLALKKQMLKTGLWASLFILLAVMFSFLGATGITKGLRAVTYATGRIAAGDLKYQIPAGAQDEVGMLGQSVNHMSQKITELMRSQVDKARFEKELETAKMVQSTFFPKAEIRSPSVTVTGFYEPASECGGDLWGHFSLGDGVEFVFIADAMGHGAPAALVTAMAYSTTMTIADLVKHEPGFKDSPARLLARLNRIIYDAVRGTISMTFFASVIDTRRGILTYANAGHNFPVVVPLEPGDPRIGKPSKRAAKQGGIQPISLKLMGTPLGMDPLTEYKEQTLPIRAGDKLFYFTDGLIECSNAKGEVWGRKFLLDQVTEAARLAAEQMRDEIVSKAFGFFGNKPLDDDVTMVVAEIAREWQPRESGDDDTQDKGGDPGVYKPGSSIPMMQGAATASASGPATAGLAELAAAAVSTVSAAPAAPAASAAPMRGTAAPGPTSSHTAAPTRGPAAPGPTPPQAAAPMRDPAPPGPTAPQTAAPGAPARSPAPVQGTPGRAPGAPAAPGLAVPGVVGAPRTPSLAPGGVPAAPAARVPAMPGVPPGSAPRTMPAAPAASAAPGRSPAAPTPKPAVPAMPAPPGKALSPAQAANTAAKAAHEIRRPATPVLADPVTVGPESLLPVSLPPVSITPSTFSLESVELDALGPVVAGAGAAAPISLAPEILSGAVSVSLPPVKIKDPPPAAKAPAPAPTPVAMKPQASPSLKLPTQAQAQIQTQPSRSGAPTPSGAKKLEPAPLSASPKPLTGKGKYKLKLPRTG